MICFPFSFSFYHVKIRLLLEHPHLLLLTQFARNKLEAFGPVAAATITGCTEGLLCMAQGEGSGGREGVREGARGDVGGCQLPEGGADLGFLVGQFEGSNQFRCKLCL